MTMKNNIWILTLSVLLTRGAVGQAQSANATDSQTTLTAITPSQTIKVSLTPNQDSVFGFTAKAGEYASIVLTHSSYNFGNCTQCIAPTVTILDPKGQSLAARQLSAAALSSQGQFVNAVRLPLSGQYRVNFASQNNPAGNVDATLFLFDNEFGAVTSNAPATVDIKYPGQKALLFFQGTAGQQVSFTLQNATFAPCHSCNSLTARIMPLAGPAIVWARISDNETSASTTSGTLPASGRYTLVIDPQGFRTGSVDVTLSLN